MEQSTEICFVWRPFFFVRSKRVLFLFLSHFCSNCCLVRRIDFSGYPYYRVVVCALCLVRWDFVYVLFVLRHFSEGSLVFCLSGKELNLCWIADAFQVFYFDSALAVTLLFIH